MPQQSIKENEIKKTEPSHKVLETEMEELNNNSNSLKEIDIHKEEEELLQDVKKSLKKTLMFDQKDITIFKICIHLSYKEEYFLMFLGLIGAIGSGVAMPLIALLAGDAVGTYGDSSDENTAGYSFEQ